MKVWLLGAVAWLAYSSWAIATTPSAKVISVGDGDTITVNQTGQKTIVRLSCIDAPELAQAPYGQAAHKHLQALLPPSTSVQLRIVDQDRYGRTVAEVFKGGQSINLAMVQEGQAVIYRQYFQGCRGSQKQYEQAELRAKQQRLGFWRQHQPVMPWAFRHRPPVSAALSRSGSAQCDPSYPDFCLPPNLPDLNCKDVPKRRFRVLPPDRHGFDGDRDGIGCES